MTMPTLRIPQPARLFWLCLVCLLLGACGFKGRPLPLEKPLPEAPGDLQARQLGHRMRISWTMPELNQDGTPTTDLAGFNLYRMIYDPQDTCPDCFDRSTLLQSIDLAYLVNAQVLEKRVFVFDRDIRPGKGYHYRVAARTAAGREGADVTVRRSALPAPPAPTGLSATGHDRMVRLTWESVTPAKGSSLLGYQIYRAEIGEPPSPAAINAAPITALSFDDYGVENDQAYSYQLRSVIRQDETTLESPASTASSATPQVGQ
jgi:hypothetical protein